MLGPNAPPAPGGALRFVSWNVKGLNSPIKRKKVISHLKQLNTKIAFLQETHLKVADHLKMRFGWVGQLYHSSFNSKARGVAVLIHKSVPFSVTEVISDPNGRYIIVSGRICGKSLTLVNVYGPNFDSEDFFKKLFLSIPNLNNSQLVMGGDFNCCLNPTLDRSSSKPYSVSKSSKAIQLFMSQYGVTDVWRHFNPNVKHFSFFSPVHSSFSRIPFFLIDNNLLSAVNYCEYTPIVISDHSPVTLDISPPGNSLSRSPWRFNPLLLKDTDFVQFISERIDLYIFTNNTPDASAISIWEACKAFLRGEIISYSAYKNKIASQKSRDLYSVISELQNICAESPSADLSKELLIKKAEFDSIATDEAVQLILRTRYSYYEFGDKPNKILSHQIRQSTAAQNITELCTSDGLILNPQTINDTFRDFYSALYTSECFPDEKRYEDFFSHLNIPTVEADVVAQLDKPFTAEELKNAVMSMQSGKSPGPDGFPSEFFKVFLDKLSPLMLNMLQTSADIGALPATLRQATISLILKKNKDPRCCSSYRPISLLCADVKILAKLLAKRLEPIMPTLISPDQTGFIKTRHSYHNIRRLMNILYCTSSTGTPEMVISMDAEKAFDRVEWSYLFYTLRRFGFGSKLLSWIKLLYTSPMARVRTNNDYSEYFPLGRGTRQGCPLSPLLFALAIEPLAAAIRTCSMCGILRGGVNHKVALYADDLLLFISDPTISMPSVLALLREFGQISGYKLNLNKSELFPINPEAMAYPPSDLPFKISPSVIRYLGVQVTKEFSDLFKTNFIPLLDQINCDLQRWSMLPLSLAGRISCIKMNVLPKFLYFFQCLPVFIPNQFFRSLDNSIAQFLWGKKPPRMRKTILQKSKDNGGLSLPNFLFYY
uniref:Reverse transcriptase domain-containing protein n=1 Tax=Oryzias sinensis TaxID=183150 RepID=A0A8C7XGJ8_9TELE